MSCLINPVLNKYEQLSEDPSRCKRELTRTAPLSMIPAVLATLLWECIKLPYALVTTPLYLATRSIRQVAKSNTVLPKVEKAFYNPKELLNCIGKIVQLMEGLLYSLVAFFNFKATANFFKGAGLFDSKLDRQRLEQEKNTRLGNETALRNEVSTQAERITTLESDLAGRPTLEQVRGLEAQIADLEANLIAAQTAAARIPNLDAQIQHWMTKAGNEQKIAKLAKQREKEDETTIRTLNNELKAAQSEANKIPSLQSQISALEEQVKLATKTIEQFQTSNSTEKKELADSEVDASKEQLEGDPQGKIGEELKQGLSKGFNREQNMLLETFTKYSNTVQEKNELSAQVRLLKDEKEHLQHLVNVFYTPKTINEYLSAASLHHLKFIHQNANVADMDKINKKVKRLAESIEEINKKISDRAEPQTQRSPVSTRKNEKNEKKEKSEREKDNVEEQRSEHNKSPGRIRAFLGNVFKKATSPSTSRSGSTTNLIQLSTSSSNLVSPMPQSHSSTNPDELLVGMEDQIPVLKRSRSSSLTNVIPPPFPAPITPTLDTTVNPNSQTTFNINDLEEKKEVIPTT